jgi:uncharacterized Zn finger protein
MSNRHERRISLLCPTCGNSQYEYETGVDETIEMAKCASCGRVLTKDELLHENEENISIHAKELGKEAVPELAQKLKDALKQAFKGNKNFRIE